MKMQYTIIEHGRRSERSGTFNTLDEAKAAIKHWDRDPMLTTGAMQLADKDGDWVDNGPAYLRTTNVVKYRTVARYFTGNPDTSLSIREEVCGE